MSIDPRTPATTLSVEEGAPITGFVAAAPNANYTLNEREKGVPVVDLCRVEGRQRTCTEVHQDVTKVFALMQNQGFLCLLPVVPTETLIECQRIEKVVQRQS